MKITLLGTDCLSSRSPQIWKELNPTVEYEIKQIAGHEIYRELSSRQDQVVNLTAPFKRIADEWCQRVGKSEGGFFGSINYIKDRIGFSTDGEAVANVACEMGLPKERVLVLGTGGMARAVLNYFLAWIEPEQLHFHGRNWLDMEELADISNYYSQQPPLLYGNCDIRGIEVPDFSKYDSVFDCTPNTERLAENHHLLAYGPDTPENAFAIRVLREQARLANNRLRGA